MTFPDFPDLDQTLTDEDYRQLRSRQVARFAQSFPELLSPCAVLPSVLDNSLLIMTDSVARVDELLEAIHLLRFEAYAVMGVERLIISAENAIVYRSETLPKQLYTIAESSATSEETTTLESDSIPLREEASHMQATMEAPVKNQSTTATMKLPTMENLTALTSRAGIDANQAVQEMVRLNLFVGWHPDGYYQTTFEAWDVYADTFSQRLKSLKGVPSNVPLTTTPTKLDNTSNGQAETIAPAPTVAATAQTKPPAARKPRTPKAPATTATASATTRFKTFKISNGANTTLGNFLTAQNYGTTQRTDLIETIAALPEVAPAEANSLAERIISKIEQVCKAKGKRLGRGKLIEGAQKMLGTGSTNS